MNPSSLENKHSRQVPCPECGQSFSARGLSGHRRLRHGLSPAAALPRATRGSLEADPAIVNALASLQDAIERIELHLASMNRPPAPPETPGEEAARLERELAAMLQQILRIKKTGLASTTIGQAASPVEKRASLELARLRRDQARLVFRLEELRHGSPREESFLI